MTAPDKQHIDLFLQSLRRDKAIVEQCAALLTPEELQRAERFVFEKDREAFCVARGTLRVLLGDYLDCEPQEVRLEAAEHGKLFLNKVHGSTIQFNLSHAKDYALFAVTAEATVGVDIEFTGRRVEHLELAKRFFAVPEQQALAALAPGDRREGFFHAWTRKEAFIKCLGQGLSYPLEDFSVNLDPNELARIDLVKGIADPASRWQLAQVLVPKDYLAAVVVESPVFLTPNWITSKETCNSGKSTILRAS